MSFSYRKSIADHFNGIYFGGNWTATNIKDVLTDVNFEEAIKIIPEFNSIATLTYHINYFAETLIRVLKGEPLTGSDALSFDLPPLKNENDWLMMVNNVLKNGDLLTQLIAEFPEEKLANPFFNEEKYGTYYSNFNGILEHTHYHLGQIVFLKKLLRNSK